MDWDDLRIFLAIARDGTLGAAARRVGQTQPTMGRRLRALEEAVGQALFQRTSEGFVLTDEGALMLAHAERMEEEALALERRLSGAGGGLAGELRLSSPDWHGLHLLVPLIADFRAVHPGVTVELLTDARLYSLARREADLIFRIVRFDEPEILQRRLTRIDYALYGARGAARPVAGEGANVALVTMDLAFGGLPDVAWLKRLLPNARVAFRSNSRDIQAAMCARGVGLAVLPRPVGDALPDLEPIDLGEAPPGRDLWIGYHRDLRRLPRLRAFLDVVNRWFAPHS